MRCKRCHRGRLVESDFYWSTRNERRYRDGTCKRCRIRTASKSTPAKLKRVRGRYHANRPAMLASMKVRNRVIRDRVFDHYGRSCACCEEAEDRFLAIDHIDGGGSAARKRGVYGKSAGGGGFYRWLIKNNFPEGFQVLCHNCNIGRALNGGTCPHKEKV